MQCELCGKNAELFTTLVEGTQLRVCAACGRFGNVLKRAPVPMLSHALKQLAQPKTVLIERIVDDYAQRMRTAREKRSLTQEDFAKHIMVKESLVHKIETGHFEPPIDLARKLEKLLHITLVETREESVLPVHKDDRPAGLTIGDVLKLKS